MSKKAKRRQFIVALVSFLVVMLVWVGIYMITCSMLKLVGVA